MSDAEQRGQDEIDKFKAMVESIGTYEQRQKIMRFASSGRAFLISYPADMTDLEIMDLAAHLFTGFRINLPQGQGQEFVQRYDGPVIGRTSGRRPT